MKTVEHDGERYLLVKRSGTSSLVRDPDTGDERYLPNAELTISGEAALETAASAIPTATRRVLTAVHTERDLGVLLELDERGPLAVTDLLESYDLCESDLYGLTTELRAAGLVEPVEVGGRRGYATAELASRGLEGLRRNDSPR